MSKRLKAELSLLGITVIWGSTFIVMKNISDDIPAYVYLTLRFSVAGIMMLVLFHKKLKGINLKALLSGSIVGFFLYACMMLQVLGLKTTSASNSAFITGLSVVFVPILSANLLKKNPPVNAIIGVIMAALGLFMIKGFSGRWVIGDTFTLMCAVCIALQIIFIDKYISKIDEYQLAIVQIVFTAIMCGLTWLIASLFITSKPLVIDSELIIAVLFTGLIATSLAIVVQTIAQKRTTPTRTALILTCEPVFATIFALIVPDRDGVRETLTLYTLIGCLFIISGMLITKLRLGSSTKITSQDSLME